MSYGQKLRSLIDAYWPLAYSEGRDGRRHDTAAGDAQRCLNDIESTIARMEAAQAPASGEVEPVKPGDPLPCPFCGSTDVGGAGGTVSCYRCPAEIAVQNANTAYAVELWNNRAISKPPAARRVPEEWREVLAGCVSCFNCPEWSDKCEDYERRARELLTTTPEAPARQVPEGLPFSESEIAGLVGILHRQGDKAHMLGGQDAGYLIDRLADFLSALTPATTPETVGDGWIDWPGDTMPVHGYTIVDVRKRWVAGEFRGPAHIFHWDLGADPEAEDVIAYRIVRNPQPPKPEEN